MERETVLIMQALEDTTQKRRRSIIPERIETMVCFSLIFSFIYIFCITPDQIVPFFLYKTKQRCFRNCLHFLP